MRTTQRPDELERWMHQSRAEAQGEVKGLLQAWIGRVRPPQEAMVELPALVLGGPEPPAECDVHELLLVCHLAVSVMHLVEERENLQQRLEELAQLSLLLARWHMPDHFKTRRTGGTWLRWVATVVPALWLVLLWTAQLDGGQRRRRRARRGVLLLHPLVQAALVGGPAADAGAGGALRTFLADQCRMVVSPPQRPPACTSWAAGVTSMSASLQLAGAAGRQRRVELLAGTGSTWWKYATPPRRTLGGSSGRSPASGATGQATSAQW